MRYTILFLILFLSQCSLKAPDLGFTLLAFLGLVSTESGATTLQVSSSTPADADTNVSVNSTITVSLNQQLSTTGLTMQNTNGSCSETVRVSSDDFQTCVGGSISYSGGTSFQITPNNTWQDFTTYKLLITTDLMSLSGLNLESEYRMESGFTTGTDTSPTVTNVTTSASDGLYSTGQSIEISIVFSQTVDVTGTPNLTLETGTNNATASYSSGSGSNTLVFSYTVSSTDTSSDLDYVSTASLSLPSGASIQNSSGVDASLTLPVPGASGSLGANHNLAINTDLFHVYVAVSGIASSGLSLQNNSDTLNVSSSGLHSFSEKVKDGNTYSVSITAQPSGQKCSFSGANSGTIATADVYLILSCGYEISVTVTNLSGTGLSLTNNQVTSDTLAISSDGTYTFNDPISSGTDYAVEVYTQPSQVQSCAVVNAGGTVASSAITNITVDCAASYASLIQSTDGIISYWRLNSGSGNDAMGSNHGTFGGAMKQGVSGGISGDSDTSAYFGTNGYLEVPYSSSLTPTTAISVELWLYARANGNCTSDIHLVSKAYSTGGYAVYCDANGLNFGIMSSGSLITTAFDVSTTRVGWHHVVGTYDGQYVRLYIDGTLENTAGGTTANITYAANNSLIIGGQSDSGSTPKPGKFSNLKMDEIAIYKKTMSAGEIKEHYRFGSRQVREYLFIIGGFNTSAYKTTAGPSVSFVSSPTNSGILDPHGTTGGAYLLSGGAYVYTTNNNDFPLGNSARTVCMFFYPESYASGTTSGLFEYGAGSDNGHFSIYLEATSASEAHISIGKGSLNTDLSVNIPLKTWTHVCSSYDGANLKSYINGIQLSNTSDTLNTSTSNMYFGAMIGGGSPFTGRIDDLRVYNTALTQIQIKEVATQVRTLLLLNYDFYDVSSTTVRDISGTGNDGTSSLTTSTEDRFGIANAAYGFSSTENTSTSNIFFLPTGTSSRTVCSWVEFTSSTVTAGAQKHLFSYGSTSTGELYSLYVSNDGTQNTLIANGGGSTLTGNIPNFLNQWNFACVGYDGSTAYLYWNAVELTNAAQTWSTADNPLLIGYRSPDSLNAYMSELRIYQRLLTTNEIKALYGNN
ncbi:MAG: LamG-like jellyroll fold domain-containing protein [Spirochaetota bacterium]